MTEAAPKRPRLSDGSLGVLWRVLRTNPLSLGGFVLVAVIVLTALVVTVDPRLLVPYGAQQFTGAIHAGPSAHHLFGTDGTGYDVFSNVMLALPLDLGIGVAIAGSALFIGGGLGLIAGFFDTPGTVGGAISVSIMRLTDIFLSFPSLILALAITRALGIGVGPTLIALAITWWPFYVRLVRGEVLAVKHLPYVTAARASGVSEWRILIRHVLRNVLEPIVVYFTLDIGTVLVTYSTIGFIGVASKYPGPQPEWGAMLAFYQSSGAINVYPWEVLGPGVAIFVTVLAFSLLGDGLRDLLDPRTRRAFVRSSAGHDPPAETPSALPSGGEATTDEVAMGREGGAAA
ncbi:MAG: ABC transporter permease [Thermoplasmata archaeon]|nr:ABC transporter permease [Thermoplasmata archaeon]MCI4356149.1 ABC transporter permease [Thermoplasmata archaeon]